MANDESNYRRVEDEKWRESVQSRLVSLTDSEVTQNDRLDDVDGEIHALREMLEGKASDRNDNGIKGDIHDLSVWKNEVRALMMPDHLGQGGVIARLKALEKKAGIEEHESDNRWKFKTAVVVAIVGLVTAFITNLDRIEPPLLNFLGIRSTASWHSKTSSTAKTNKKRRRRPVVTEEPTEEPDESTPEGVR